MQPQLIATDLDGTLLNERGELSRVTVDTLEHLVRAGHSVVAVTGRSRYSAVPCLSQLSCIKHIICSNGAYRYSTEDQTLTNAQPIPPAHWTPWLEALAATHADVCFGWETDRGVEYQQKFIELTGDPENLLKVTRHRPDSADSLFKLFIRRADGDVPELQRTVSRMLADKAEVSTSGAPFVEATARNVDKGTALAKHAREFGFDAENTIAFGDNYNDLSMLRWAGRSFAMANAVPEVKDLVTATTVTGNNDDGVAKALQALALTSVNTAT